MATHGGSPASNLVYDLVAIQCHALNGAQVYDQYVRDATGNADVETFVQQVRDEDAQRAVTARELLAKVTTDGLNAAA